MPSCFEGVSGALFCRGILSHRFDSEFIISIQFLRQSHFDCLLSGGTDDAQLDLTPFF